MQADLAIRGATVIFQGAHPRDILITDGKISALVEAGALTARTEIDARGLYALPGLVDAHVHFNEPGRADWEGWESGSRAAAAGGVTTVLDMPLNSLPPVIDGAAFDLKRAAAERTSIVDFGLWGGLIGSDPAPLRELAARGAVGVKAFLCDSGVPEFPSLSPLDDVYAFRAAADAGLLVAVHAEDDEIVAGATARIHAEGRHDPAAWLMSRPPVAEVRGVDRAWAAALEASARLHIVHISSAAALAAIDDARRAGVDVTAETCPHYLVFDDTDVARLGPLLKCAPPIRDAANREALWAAVTHGRIDLIASDHSPCLAADKERGRENMFAAWGGVSGVQSLLPAVLTEAFARGSSLHPDAIMHFAAWRMSSAPAKRFGLAPRKGSLAVGADADIVLVDGVREWVLEAGAVQTRNALTPYVGRTFRGAVVRTLVRGATVYLDGEFPARPGHGRFIAAERAA